MVVQSPKRSRGVRPLGQRYPTLLEQAAEIFGFRQRDQTRWIYEAKGVTAHIEVRVKASE
jgi:hypothetical protein